MLSSSESSRCTRGFNATNWNRYVLNEWAKLLTDVLNQKRNNVRTWDYHWSAPNLIAFPNGFNGVIRAFVELRPRIQLVLFNMY